MVLTLSRRAPRKDAARAQERERCVVRPKTGERRTIYESLRQAEARRRLCLRSWKSFLQREHINEARLSL